MRKYPVTLEKERELLERMLKLGIFEDDIDESFIRGSGSGGQKINKTSNCARLYHAPSGIEVRCQTSRSLAMNRFLARRMLCEKFEEQSEGEKSKKEREREKIRRQKRKRSKRAKEKILAEKRVQSDKKSGRKKIKMDSDDTD
ncbi:peptide chain release factor-like protein [bacterium]|nr:peptide chain release factor-like protein [bacterium]